MMILRSAALVAAALTLSNCCMSPSGCGGGPVAMTAMPPAPRTASPAAPAGWDGLDDTPMASEDAKVDVTPSKRRTRRIADVDSPSSSLSARSRTDLSWEQQQALDREEDARLSQKLIICKNCGPSR